jgi:MoxR-like ATPase
MVGKAEQVSVAVQVRHDQLKELVKLYYKAKKALFVWGATGVGKSQVVRQAAMEIAQELGLEYTEDVKHLNDEKYFVVIDIRLSQSDPSDLRGIPIYDKEHMATVWLPPELFPRKGYGIIFFDELNLSPPLVQASAYQLILDRRLGTYV